MRRLVAFACFRGRSAAEVRALGERYAATLSAGVRPEVLERIRWHRASGHTVVIVSASLDVYLAPFARSLGVDVIATELEVRNGILTGRYDGGDCTGAQKASRVAARYDVRGYSLVYAYGDTVEDEALLALAHRRFFRGREVTVSG